MTEGSGEKSGSLGFRIDHTRLWSDERLRQRRCLYIYLEESVTLGTSCFSRLELLTGEIEEVLFSRVVEFKGEGEKQGLAEG